MRRKIFLIFIWFVSIKVNSQTVSPSVINTTGGGGAVGSSGVEVYYNVGEPIVSTVSNNIFSVTQGFLQPDIVGEFDLIASALSQNESCLNKQDGYASVILNSIPSGASQILYVWSPTSICPGQNCSSVDSLLPGTYSVVVKALNSSGIVIDSVTTTYTITASTEPCQITVYNGFTPNGDGLNDTWVIENIENFPTNTVTIFNRWGNQLWSTNNYNNTSNVWDGKSTNGAVLTSGTYFYVIEIDNGSAIKKGWVELTGK
ncbi:MAG: gliding motility-associated C-terminal domain-containing protein [Bacteroidia bacterium]